MKIIFAKYDTDVEQDIKDADMLDLGMQTEMVQVSRNSYITLEQYNSGSYPFKETETSIKFLERGMVRYDYTSTEKYWVLDATKAEDMIGLIDYVDSNFGNGLEIFRSAHNKGYFECQW